jgi:hypothetical protein
MRTIARYGSIIATFALLGTLAVAAPKNERAKKYFDVAGKVIQIDQKDRTLLVKDRQSNLYEIRVPEGATFKITFGRYMKMVEPGFNDVRTGERIEIRCKADKTEHLSRLADGRTVTRLTAAL